MINVLIVDDHPIVRDGLEVLLASEGDFSIHGSVASAEEALAHCAKKGAPDVVVTDVHMPGGMIGLELLARLKKDFPTVRVILLAGMPLKAGHAYEYQVWVKTENLTGNESGATVCIEWNDANGKWLGGAYVGGVKGTKDWTCVKGVTDKVPKEAASARVSPYVRKGMKGKAWF